MTQGSPVVFLQYTPFSCQRSLQSRKEMDQTCRYHPGVPGTNLVNRNYPLTAGLHQHREMPLAAFHVLYRYILYAVNHAYKSFKLITQWCIKYISLSIESSLSVVIPQGTIDSESAGTYLIISFYCKMMMFIDITIRQTLKWSRC